MKTISFIFFLLFGLSYAMVEAQSPYDHEYADCRNPKYLHHLRPNNRCEVDHYSSNRFDRDPYLRDCKIALRLARIDAAADGKITRRERKHLFQLEDAIERRKYKNLQYQKY